MPSIETSSTSDSSTSSASAAGGASRTGLSISVVSGTANLRGGSAGGVLRTLVTPGAIGKMMFR